jgi:hypothetical protein
MAQCGVEIRGWGVSPDYSQGCDGHRFTSNAGAGRFPIRVVISVSLMSISSVWLVVVVDFLRGVFFARAPFFPSGFPQ